MPDPDHPRPRSPLLGRAVAFALAALVVMVALGVLWVWQRASRERELRERVNASEPFIPLQSNRPAPPPPPP